MSTEAIPVAMRYFEDFPAGTTFEHGEVVVSEDEILEFARRFDPQPFHVDREAAARGQFGGLIASGWHTAAMMMRLLCESFLSDAAGMSSPGIDELRWKYPVRPGDRLRIWVEVVEATRSRSKPDRGLLRTAITVLNQRDEPAMTMVAMTLMGCRDAG
jgi:acyl dehydratase